MEEFHSWMQSHLTQFEEFAAAVLPSADLVPQRLHEAMRYSVLNGGKRVRPLLCYAAALLTDAETENVNRSALAIECVHSYSLIHDDLPCMDNDVLRHGKPTSHVQFGEATAMLAGDALQPEAFLILIGSRLQPEQKVELVRLLAGASSTFGMCGGQAIDIEATGRIMGYEDLRNMHRMKTGALLKASVLMGAWSGCREKIDDALLRSLTGYGDAVGLAFQIVDDILDATQTAAVLGKTAGKDAKDNKATYVTMLGLERARTLAHEQLDLAVGCLDALPEEYQPATVRLREIAHFIVDRTH